ncbi:hypothetical protein NL676_037294 [Syzygium grande]|nr:hypothetical protein NL676_037294 [Syzygium grande]
MNLSRCPRRSDITLPFVEGLHHVNVNPKPALTVGRSTRRTRSHRGSKNVIKCSHLMPGHLEGSFVVKKQVEEPPKKLEFVRTLLIDNYDSYTYNIYQELSVINGVPPVVIRNDSWTWKDIYHHLYEENAFDNVVVSPGPGFPTCPADVGEYVFSCCLNARTYQFWVFALDTSEIEHSGSRLFHDIPSGRNLGFKVVRYHSLVLDAQTLPEELIPIAWTASSDALSFRENNVVPPDAYAKTREGYSTLFSEIRNENSWPFTIPKKYEAKKSLWPLCILLGLIMVPHANHISGQVCLTNTPSVEINGDHLLQEVTRSRRPVYDLDERNYLGMSNLGTSPATIDVKLFKLTWRRLEGLAARLGGAKNIFCELFSDNKAENSFWLDSSSIEKGRARFSLMGGKGGPLWKQLTFRLDDRSDAAHCGGYLSVEDAQDHASSTYLEKGFLDFLNKELLSFHCEEKDFEGLPFEFYGGFVGYLGYNLKVECGAATNRHKSTAPDACFLFADNLVVVDHLNDDAYLMSIHDRNTHGTTWLDNTEEKLLALRTAPTDEPKNKNTGSTIISPCEAGFCAEKSKEQYMEDVRKCLKYIKDGESYELCFTTQIRKTVEEMDPLKLYLHLRESNPAPYAAWLNFAKENLHICCSSPERFLWLDRNGSSMTGAPKLRSMELLDSLESCPRGIYSGSIGFFSINQMFDLNIVIRTVMIHENEASIGAGGAIVALSNPKDEYEEMNLKTRAPVKAVVDI